MRRPAPSAWAQGPRLIVSGGAGAVAAAICGFTTPWQASLLFFWVAAALAWLLPIWCTVVPLDAGATRSHASREDPHGAIADTLLLSASVSSLGAVILGILKASGAQGPEKLVLLGAGMAAIISSWGVVHTVFTLRYASLYYKAGEGAEMHGSGPPVYADFAYIAFTIGMTYQVSDTDLTTKSMRHAALRHALLSYLLGTVVIAATINLAAGLAK